MSAQNKLYTERQVSASAFFGGPIPAGILIYSNLMKLGKDKEAYITLAGIVMFTIALFYASLKVPNDIYYHFPTQLIPTIIGAIIWGIYHFLVADIVDKQMVLVEGMESNWKVARVTIGGIILTTGILFSIAFTEPAFPGEKLIFDGNEVYFDSKTISEKEAGKLSSQLYATQFFSTETYTSASIKKEEGTYIIQIPLEKEVWEDSGVTDAFYSLKWLLEVDLNGKVTVILEHYDLSGRTLTKTL